MPTIHESPKCLEITIKDENYIAVIRCQSTRYPVEKLLALTFVVLECNFSTYNEAKFQQYWSVEDAFPEDSSEPIKTYISRKMQKYFKTEAKPVYKKIICNQ